MSYHEGLLGRSPGVSRFAQIGNTRVHRIIRVIDHNFPEQIIERAHKIEITSIARTDAMVVVRIKQKLYLSMIVIGSVTRSNANLSLE